MVRTFAGSRDPWRPRAGGYPVGVSALRGNRRFLLVVVPMFVVAIGLVVAYLALRPTIRRNAAILLESKLRLVASVVAEIRDAEGGLAAATSERLNEVGPQDMEFLDAEEASDEPLVVSVALTDDAWNGAAKADSGACYFVRLTPEGDTLRGTIPGSDCTGAAASRAEARGWPEV
jgi:hypothetical protein